eukprot:366346-Chlamydomonas_euryale.AAC.4
MLEKNALLGYPNLLIYVDIPRSGTRTRGRVLRSYTTEHPNGMVTHSPCVTHSGRLPSECRAGSEQGPNTAKS